MDMFEISLAGAGTRLGKILEDLKCVTPGMGSYFSNFQLFKGRACNECWQILELGEKCVSCIGSYGASWVRYLAVSNPFLF